MRYFTFYELEKSATAARLGINNEGDQVVRANLRALVENVLDPLREAWGEPIIVTSGYRCPRLNAVVGGSSSSQHQVGMACDIRTVSDSRESNMRLLRKLLSLNLPFDQLICEYPDKEGRPDWIHVSYKRGGKQRGQQLTARRLSNGKTAYSYGIKV